MPGLALVVAIGCGSDGFDPSAPGNKPLDQLTTQEATTLCEESIAHFKAVYPQSRRTEDDCRVAGLTAARDVAFESPPAELQAACKSAYAACKSDPPAPPQDFDCAGARAELARCTATVDQYAACLNEQLDHVIPSCAGLTRQIIIDEITASGDACEVYYASCELPN